MKKRIQYLVLFIILFIVSTIIPMIVTNAKYVSKISLETDISIGTMVFNIKQSEGQPDQYQIVKGNNVTAKYKLRNKDEDNNINKLDLRYFLKIVDNNDNEVDSLQFTVSGYNYLEYKVDQEGNIIDIDGNIVNENGEIIEERQLTQQENTELQNSLVTVKKGYGPINLSYDGQTLDEKELSINITCPAGYTGAKTLNYKVKIIAEGLFNKDFTAEETANLNIKIYDTENEMQQANLLQNSNNTNTNNVNTNEVSNNVNANEIQTNTNINELADFGNENENEITNNSEAENNIDNPAENSMNTEELD